MKTKKQVEIKNKDCEWDFCSFLVGSFMTMVLLFFLLAIGDLLNVIDFIPKMEN